jgi:hypothetical protein
MSTTSRPSVSVSVALVDSGVTGWRRALESAQAGACVVVPERELAWGRTSRLRGPPQSDCGYAASSGLGIADDVELALGDLVAMGGPSSDVDWARAS